MTQTILIVDDAIAQHKLIASALDGESIGLQSAFTGDSGLAMAASLQPDLILLDVDMPEMNGFDVCRLLKVNVATRDIPVIFITASASMDERICGFDLGAVDYITKPFDPAELLARVRVAFRTSEKAAGRKMACAVAADEAGAGLPTLLPVDRDRGCGRPLIEQLSLAERTQLRSENPWNRIPPSSADSTAAHLKRDGALSQTTEGQ